jgi:S1-C subfamily serine protease
MMQIDRNALEQLLSLNDRQLKHIIQRLAAESGIEDGDILTEINGMQITSMDELNAILFEHGVGDTVTVTIYRAGKIASVELELAEDKG